MTKKMTCSDVRNGEIICEEWGVDYQQLSEDIAFYEGYSLTFFRDDGLTVCKATAIEDTKKHHRGESFIFEGCFSKIDNLNSAIEHVSMQVSEHLLENDHYIVVGGD